MRGKTFIRRRLCICGGTQALSRTSQRTICKISFELHVLGVVKLLIGLEVKESECEPESFFLDKPEPSIQGTLFDLLGDRRIFVSYQYDELKACVGGNCRVETYGEKEPQPGSVHAFARCFESDSSSECVKPFQTECFHIYFILFNIPQQV